MRFEVRFGELWAVVCDRLCAYWKFRSLKFIRETFSMEIWELVSFKENQSQRVATFFSQLILSRIHKTNFCQKISCIIQILKKINKKS
jgi:hypothetical protein